MTRQDSSIDLDRELVERITIHKNIGQEIVVTTVDKVRLCLIEHRDCLESKNEWLKPLSLGLVFLTTLTAAQFQDWVVKAAVWQAIYIIGVIACAVWLVRSAFIAFRNRARGGVDELVGKLKAPVVQPPP